ncbi:hypothetical protein BAUCODRAFT_417228 [Baudoinia panamericana UAMH 10762]|uniref:Cytochrome P450 monooxygenase n=1 Tax=Baudoinia panamericana (strain UAMH 10762) TaxID=717646 RepID=M2LUH3_BAUPA|nr:uncharacterized protein BAUCODRAFT_417228 [Baudoinia panamericana UAMH 10762]EMC98232.1 hypothetical protein BAUCODRAFT_417228 [Baudoinia panamericana UAMH 10762]
MLTPAIPTITLALLLGIVVYRLVFYPILLSPLAKIPSAHWTAPFSRLWILYYRSRQQETPTVHNAHARLGPIVRLAPNEISVNCVDGGIRTIYAGGYEKGDWYINVFNNYGIPPMFSMPEHGPHSRRRRMFSNIYAKSTLQNSAALTTITKTLLKDRLVQRMREMSRSDKPIEFYYLFTAITLDFVSAYVFGLANASRCIEKPDLDRAFFEDYKMRQPYQFWPQEMPILTALLERTGLKWLIVPHKVSSTNNGIEAWILQLCDQAEIVMREADGGKEPAKPEDWPTVYAQLRNALSRDLLKQDLELGADASVQTQRMTKASEMLDHTLAGFDTSSILLTFFAWRLSRPENATWQEKLRKEFAGLTDEFDAKAVDALPMLHAALMETLRLHASIPGNQPRITPAAATLGVSDHAVSGIPAGVRVQSQAWSLHRNPQVFPDPEAWRPERWLESSETQMREMNRWFWAFGSGGRMCVGSNLAMYDMKAIIVAIWSRFETEVVFDEGMTHKGGYVAEPAGKDGRVLELRVTEL